MRPATWSGPELVNTLGVSVGKLVPGKASGSLTVFVVSADGWRAVGTFAERAAVRRLYTEARLLGYEPSARPRSGATTPPDGQRGTVPPSPTGDALAGSGPGRGELQ
jgi:hypothetical protein